MAQSSVCVELEEEEEAMVELQTWVKWRVWGGDLVICWCRRTLVFYEKNLNDHDVLTTILWCPGFFLIFLKIYLLYSSLYWLTPYRYINVFECHSTGQKYLENRDEMSIILLLYEMKLSLTHPLLLLLSYLLKHTSSFNVAIKSTFSCFYNVFWNLSQFVVCTAVEETQRMSM